MLTTRISVLHFQLLAAQHFSLSPPSSCPHGVSFIEKQCRRARVYPFSSLASKKCVLSPRFLRSIPTARIVATAKPNTKNAPRRTTPHPQHHETIKRSKKRQDTTKTALRKQMSHVLR